MNGDAKATPYREVVGVADDNELRRARSGDDLIPLPLDDDYKGSSGTKRRSNYAHNEERDEERRRSPSSPGETRPTSGSERKRQKREKNRIAARACRKRKQEALEKCLEEIRAVEAENARLRVRMSASEGGEEVQESLEAKAAAELDGMVKAGATDTEIRDSLDYLTRQNNDFGTKALSSIDFHVLGLERNLAFPTQILAPLAAAAAHVGGDGCGGGAQLTSPNNGTTTSSDQARAASASSPPSAIWAELLRTLGLAPEQVRSLRQRGHEFKDAQEYRDQAMAHIAQIRKALFETSERMEIEFTKLQDILTPRQNVLFALWVLSHPECMGMLDEIWKREFGEEVSAFKIDVPA